MNMSEYPYRVTVELKDDVNEEQKKEINLLINEFVESGKVVKLDEITYATNKDKYDTSFLSIRLKRYKEHLKRLEYCDIIDGILDKMV